MQERLDPSSWTFAGGETKRQLFDLVTGELRANAWQFPAGQYMVRGAYGEHWSDYISVTLGP